MFLDYFRQALYVNLRVMEGNSNLHHDPAFWYNRVSIQEGCVRSYISDFNNISGMKNDAADLAAAQDGYSNGRNQRFLNALDSDASSAGRSKNKSNSITDIILTQSPEYAALVEAAMGNVRDAEDAVDRVLELASERFAESQAALEALEDRAMVLPDGRKVALDAEGNVRALGTGLTIDPEIAASIEWQGHEPRYEEIEAARERADADLQVLTNARRDEVRLGEIRSEIEAQPPADRLNELSQEAEAIKDRNVQALEALENKSAVAPVAQSDFEIGSLTVPSI